MVRQGLRMGSAECPHHPEGRGVAAEQSSANDSKAKRFAATDIYKYVIEKP